MQGVRGEGVRQERNDRVTGGGQRMFPLLFHGETGQKGLQFVTFRGSRKSLYATESD